MTIDWDVIKKLIKVIKDEDISGLAVEDKGVKYEVKRERGGVSVTSPVASHVPVPTAPHHTPAPIEKEDDGLVAITSPMVGTFYRSPSPESPPFVSEGDVAQSGKVVCIIEAMKLFNEIEAEISGKVVKILAENGKPVEYGQKLMLIKKD